jgi:outer membrane protein
MKKLSLTLLSLGAFCATGLISHADTTPKIVVADIAKIYDSHYETQAEQVKLKAETDKAQATFDQMIKDRNDLVTEYKKLVDDTNNPVSTPDAKAKAQADAQKKGQEAQQKQNDAQQFAQNARATLQQRIQNFRSMMIEEINKVVKQVADTHNATLVLDKSAVSPIGAPVVIYADSSYDITDEVIAEIAKHKPATPAAAAPDASAPSTAAPAPSTSPDMPSITVPGAPAK